MKKWMLIITLALMALIGVLVTLHAPAGPVPARSVRLDITGPDGQKFTGKYVADDVTNSIRGLTPAALNLRAREVTYEFQREGGEGEFRVAFSVEGLCRTSTTSVQGPGDQGQGVRGKWQYTANREVYWAAGF